MAEQAGLIAPPRQRSAHLDALRGLAAMIVVTTHFLAAFYPWSVFGGGSRFTVGVEQRFAWESLLHWPPLSILTAGHFAVCLFFILSGYVLSARFIGEPGQIRRIAGAIIKRPFRLAGLALFSIVLGAALWSAKLLLTEPVGMLAGSSGWLDTFWVGKMQWSTFWHELLTGKIGSKYNPPLWTIKIEVIGSFLVYFVLLAINWMPRWARGLVLLALLVPLFGSYYDGFIIGMILADQYKRGVAPGQGRGQEPEPAPGQAPTGKRKHLALWALSALALLLAGYPYYAADVLLPGWALITPHISMAGATVVFLVAHSLPTWRKTLSRRWLTGLGDISYAIYVLHFLLMATVSSWLVIALTPAVGFGSATALAFCLSMPLLIVLSVALTRWVDKPCMALGHWVERKVRLARPPRELA